MTVIMDLLRQTFSEKGRLLMMTTEAMVKVEEFMTRWNNKHKFVSILELYPLFCSVDDAEKMIGLKRRLTALRILQEDLIVEIQNHPQGTHLRGAFLFLLSQTGEKIIVAEDALDRLIKLLVNRELAELMNEAVTEMFDFDVEVLETDNLDIAKDLSV